MMLVTRNLQFFSQLRGSLNEPPFLRILYGFRSFLTINRHCPSEKMLQFLRWHFSLIKSSLPILLYEVKTNEEILLTDLHQQSVLIRHGIYLALLQYDSIRYEPLIDLTLIPTELFPEKICLPNQTSFVLNEVQPFAQLLINLVDYMIDEEKSHVFRPLSSKENETPVTKKELTISPSRKSSQLSAHRTRERSVSIPTSNANLTPDSTLTTPQSVSSIVPILMNDRIDIQKYSVTDPQRLNCNADKPPTLPFTFEILHPMMQMERPIFKVHNSKMNSIDMVVTSFNENELILFKFHLSVAPLEPSVSLKLFNCIHQLAIDHQLAQPNVVEILNYIDQRLRHYEFHDNHVEKIIRNLQNVSMEIKKREISPCNISNLMKILIRIDQLARYKKLNLDKVKIFNRRLYHLARLGAINTSSKLCKKLTQIDLYGYGHLHQLNFNQFVDVELQRHVPKPFPLNSLGIEEIIHQLRINIDRLGPVITLMLIDNLQRLVRCGLLFNLHQNLPLKQALVQLIEHIQTSRLNGMFIQRLFEQINTSTGLTSVKKTPLTNQLSSSLQKMKLKDKHEQNKTKTNYDQYLAVLLKFADQGKLHSCLDVDIDTKQMSHDHRSSFSYSSQDCCNPLQSLLVFLQEQGLTSNTHFHQFIEYLRHFAQLGLLDCSPLLYLIAKFHRMKDKDTFQLKFLIHFLEQMKTINYTQVYSHLNLVDVDHFLINLMLEDELTHGQYLYLLDRFSQLCRSVSMTDYALSHCLREIQIEYARQQGSFKNWIDAYQILAKSYSSGFNELCGLEKEMNEIVSSHTNTLKRIPEEVRRRLQEILILCQILKHHAASIDPIFDSMTNMKFYEKFKEIFKTKAIFNRKQSLTALNQVHKHLLESSKDFGSNILTAEQIDSILSIIQEKCPEERFGIELALKHLAELGHLQEKTLIEYFMERILATGSTKWTSQQSLSIRRHLQEWPLKLNLHHNQVQPVIQHLTQLETEDRLDSGTSIEIQNRLNQLAHLDRYSDPQIQLIVKSILDSTGKRNSIDYDGFERMQSYRLRLNDVLHTIELGVKIQKWTNEHRLPYHYNYRFRNYLYQILQNHQPIDEFHRIQELDIDQVKRWIDSFIPHDPNMIFPLTLTDQILFQLKWDGKNVDQSIRESLLELECHGILTRDTFNDIYYRIFQTSNLSIVPSIENKTHQLYLDLIEKINSLRQMNQIDLTQWIRMKEQITFIDGILDLPDYSAWITIQSRLLNASNHDEWMMMTDALNTFALQEQFRVSKATDLIQHWQLNNDRTNGPDKKILRLFRELAQMNRLYDPSAPHYLQRYISMKSIHSNTHRQLIRDLQRLKTNASIDKQATDRIRSLEARLSKFDSKKRLTDSLMIKLEMRLKQIFHHLSRPSDEASRTEIIKNLGNLLETHIKSTTENNLLVEKQSEELIETFDLHIARHTNSGPLRQSKTHYPIIPSDVPIVKLSPSVQSLQSLS